MKTIYTLIFTLFFMQGFTQEVGEGHFQMNGGIDLYNTGNRNPVQIAQRFKGDFDMNYYVAKRFTVGVGFDYVNRGLRRANFSPGFRWYFGDTFFFRTKAYISNNLDYFDIGPGIGNDFFLSDNWAIEGNIDYLVRANNASIRVGLALFL